MILNQQQTEEMLEAAKPLIRWLNENGHPHCAVHVDQNTVEFTECIALKRVDELQSTDA